MAQSRDKSKAHLAGIDSAQLGLSTELGPVWVKLAELLEDLYDHSGFGQIQITMRWLKKSRKEIILHCGKEYRFVVDAKPQDGEDAKSEDDAEHAS